MAQDWDIKSRSESCKECNMQFQDRQQYFSALVFGEEGYVRQDYCGRCWMGGKEAATAPYSQWQGIFRPPPPPPVEALKKETAESLLRRLIETDDGTRVNVMYILAVMLERKRILVEKDIQKREDGTKVIVYEHKKTAEVFLIPDPQLQLDQLEHVQIEVVDLLGRHDAAMIPGTETADPLAAPVPPGGESQPVPVDAPATEEAAEVKAVEPVAQEPQEETAEQTIFEESAPEVKEEALPPKKARGRKKNETPAEKEPDIVEEAGKPEPAPESTSAPEPEKPEIPATPGKSGRRGKAAKVVDEAAPVAVAEPEQVAEQVEEKKPEKQSGKKAGKAPKQKKGATEPETH